MKLDGITKVNQSSPATNLIIGGDFSTNPWQRGTSFTNANGLTADRFYFAPNGPSNVNVTQEATIVPSVAQAEMVVTKSLKMACSTAEAVVASTSYKFLVQNMEGYDFCSIAQQPFTISFWVYSSVTGTYCINLRNEIADRSYVAEYTVNVANTWEKKSITIPASPSSGTWNYSNGSGLYVGFTLSCGTTYQTTANSWNTGNFLGTSNQVNFTSSTSNVFYISLIQVEKGNTATAFQQRSILDELFICQRWYEKSFDNSLAPGQVGGAFFEHYQTRRAIAGSTPGTLVRVLKFKVPKRVTPTMTLYNPYTGSSGSIEIGAGSPNVRTGCTITNVNQNQTCTISVSNADADAIPADVNLAFNWAANAE